MDRSPNPPITHYPVRLTEIPLTPFYVPSVALKDLICTLALNVNTQLILYDFETPERCPVRTDHFSVTS